MRKPAGAARREARPVELAGKVLAAVSRKLTPDLHGPAYVSPEDTGAHRIRAKLALRAASSRFLAHLPAETRQPTPDDLIDAAKDLLPDLQISRATWRYACQIVGPYPAALCVLITDRAAVAGNVARPGGYFRGMAKRALYGELALDRSIFSFLNSWQGVHECKPHVPPVCRQPSISVQFG